MKWLLIIVAALAALDAAAYGGLVWMITQWHPLRSPANWCPALARPTTRAVLGRDERRHRIRCRMRSSARGQ